MRYGRGRRRRNPGMKLILLVVAVIVIVNLMKKTSGTIGKISSLPKPGDEDFMGPILPV